MTTTRKMRTKAKEATMSRSLLLCLPMLAFACGGSEKVDSNESLPKVTSEADAAAAAEASMKTAEEADAEMDKLAQELDG